MNTLLHCSPGPARVVWWRRRSACSFSASSESSAASSESSAHSSESSSKSSSPDSKEATYRDDVRDYTEAYVKSGGQFDAFQKRIGELAKQARHHELGRQPGHLRGHRRRTRSRQGQPGPGRRLQAEPRPRAIPGRWRPSRRRTTRSRRMRAPRARARSREGCSSRWPRRAPALTPRPHGTIDYLYVEANEAGGSGGHAAIRFGDRVFHFQWTDAGLLGVSREDFEGFRRHYALLENRTIRVIRIPVSDGDLRPRPRALRPAAPHPAPARPDPGFAGARTGAAPDLPGRPPGRARAARRRGGRRLLLRRSTRPAERRRRAVGRDRGPPRADRGDARPRLPGRAPRRGPAADGGARSAADRAARDRRLDGASASRRLWLRPALQGRGRRRAGPRGDPDGRGACSREATSAPAPRAWPSARATGWPWTL